MTISTVVTEGQGNDSLPRPVHLPYDLPPNAAATAQKGLASGSVRPDKPATSAADKARL
jgi:hypothetical protein